MSLARQMLELDLAWISRSSNGQLRFVPANDQEAGVNKCQWPGRQVLELDWDLDLSTNGWQMSMARGAGGLDLAQVLAHAWEPHAPPPFYSDLSLYPLSSPLWLFWIRDWIERGGVFKPRNQSAILCACLPCFAFWHVMYLIKEGQGICACYICTYLYLYLCL